MMKGESIQNRARPWDDSKKGAYDDPPTSHMIKCRSCEKQKKVPMRITLVCNTCRTARGYRADKGVVWDTWGSK